MTSRLNDPSYYNNPTLLISQVFSKRREINDTSQSLYDRTGKSEVKKDRDPFQALKEAVETQKYLQTCQDIDPTKESYNQMVDQTYESMHRSAYHSSETLSKGYDPSSLEEKMKKFKFANTLTTEGSTKDGDWFKKFQSGLKSTGSSSDQPEKPKIKFGLSKEDEQQIHREMIPKFIAIQNELYPKQQLYKSVAKELDQLRQEFKVEEVKKTQPMIPTSFM
jgi:hypothetical protein